MCNNSVNAAGRPDRPNPGRWKWPVWLFGGFMAITIAMSPHPAGDDIWASTDDIRSAAPGGAVVRPAAGPHAHKEEAGSDPEPAGHSPAPDRPGATADQKQPTAESEPGELDTFSPSETIEADQGVDFPYDI